MKKYTYVVTYFTLKKNGDKTTEETIEIEAHNYEGVQEYLDNITLGSWLEPQFWTITNIYREELK